MDEVVLTLYCASADRELMTGLLRDATRAPVHVREEQVLGHDFGDAGTSERVRGSLKRIALELVVATSEAEALVGRIETARRNMPVRWRTVAVAARGRLV